MGDDLGELDRLLLQHDLALADARDVEELVHQPRELRHLAVDHVARHDQALLGGGDAPHELHGVLDRRERIPQLVREHRQELVLAAVRVLQLFLRLPGARDLPLQGSIEPRVIQGNRRPAGYLRQHVAVAGLASGVAERKSADHAVADLQRIAERGSEPRLVGALHHLVVAQNRLHGRRKRRRHEVGGGGAQHIELARLLLDGDRRGVANVWHHEIQQPPHALLEVERGAELVACVREEIRAPPRLLGRGPRHLGFGHGARPLLHLVELDEHLHLAAQHVRPYRREDVVHRAERVALRGLHLVRVRGDENDRRVRRLLVLADEAPGLQAVDVGHVDVEQDYRELAREHLLQRFAARAHRDEVLPELLEDAREDQQLLGQVVYDQDVGFLLVHRASGAATLSARTAYARGRPAWTDSPRRRRQYISRGRPSWLSP